jgi:Ca2+-binding RTX toxin-like protein
LTVSAVDTNIDSGTTITGGSGVDTLNITTSNTTAVAVNIGAVTKVETINITAGSAGSGYDASIDLGTYTTALTINGNTLVTGEDLTVIGGSATGAVTVNGTAGVNNILTGTGADVITAGSGADTINSGSGNDYIDGGAGIDTLEGMAGNDTILGGDGADSIVGGAGIDSLVGGSGNDVFYVGSTASDFITLTTAEVVSGGTGTDKLTIAADTDVNNTDLVGLSSIEEIEFTAAATTSIVLADNVFTANGAATLTVSDTGNSYATTVSAGTLSAANSVTVTYIDTYADIDQSITLGAGNDTVNVTANATVTGFEASDTIIGGSGTDTLNIVTTSGADITSVNLTKVSGFETIKTVGAATADKAFSINVIGITDDLVATGSSLTFDFSDRTDVVTLMGGSESDILIITTGTAADSIVSGSGADIISSGSGNDTITSGAGADSILGGAGADSITADAGNDTVAGEAGDDIIVAGSGNDVLDGGSGADVITGGAGVDNITGGTGNDTFAFTAVSDSSGTTFDTITDWVSADDTLQIALSYSTAVTAQTINAAVLTANTNDNINPSLSGYKGEAIYDTTNSRLYVNYTDGSSTGITSLDYTIAINAAATATATIADGDINFVITGGAAGDSITAGGGIDTIDGGSGNDTITGGAGNDSLTGGADADLFVLAGSDTVVDFSSTASDTLTLTGLASGDVVTFSSVIGTLDFTDATAGAILVATGGNGGVVITGDTAADTITGGTGADSLGGAAGVDYLSGGTGVDTINGGAASDVLTGGAGADLFIWSGTFAQTGTAAIANGGTAVTALGTAGFVVAAADTFTGFEVITDFATADASGEKLGLGNADAADNTLTLADDKFIIVQGTYVSSTGVFTVGASGTTGDDSILIWDSLATDSSIVANAVVIVGMNNTEEGYLAASSGVLTA